MWTETSRRTRRMLTNSDIEQYKQLQKETAEANVEKQTMKAEIQVLRKQGIEKLKKYGFENFSDIPKLQAKLKELEEQVLKERDAMKDYCAYIAEKKMEKLTLFNKEEIDDM